MFSLIEYTGGGFLNATTVWDVPGAELEELRSNLAARADLDDPALIRLSFINASVSGALMTLATSADEVVTLATSNTSGHPPYSALLTAQLNADQVAVIGTALRGDRGTVNVEYQIRLTGAEKNAGAKVSGDLTELIASLHAADNDAVFNDPGLLKDMLIAEIEKGTLTFEMHGDEQLPEQLIEQLLDLTAEWVRNNADRYHDGERMTIVVETELTYEPKVEWTLRCDLADWGVAAEHRIAPQ